MVSVFTWRSSSFTCNTETAKQCDTLIPSFPNSHGYCTLTHLTWPTVLNYFKVYRSDRCLFLEARATQADAIPCFVCRDIIYWVLIRSLIPLCCDLVVLNFKETSESLEQNCTCSPLLPSTKHVRDGPSESVWVSKQGVEYVISSCHPSDDHGGGTVYLSWWLDTEGVGWQTQFCMRHTQH